MLDKEYRPRIVTGADPLTQPILDYLSEMYRIPPAHIKSLSLISSVGDVQLLTVTLMVQKDFTPATGGIVKPTDSSYRVGERGSEWIDPPTERIRRGE